MSPIVEMLQLSLVIFGLEVELKPEEFSSEKNGHVMPEKNRL